MKSFQLEKRPGYPFLSSNGNDNKNVWLTFSVQYLVTNRSNEKNNTLRIQFYNSLEKGYVPIICWFPTRFPNIFSTPKFTDIQLDFINSTQFSLFRLVQLSISTVNMSDGTMHIVECCFRYGIYRKKNIDKFLLIRPQMVLVLDLS